MRIALIDSGIGGLTLLKRLLDRCPANDYVYFADTYAHPYGRERANSLKVRIARIAELLYENGAEMLIFACNTASTVALDFVKKELPIPVFGVKPTYVKEEKTLIMCTPLTAKSELVKGYEREGAKVYANLCLASLIEENRFNVKALDDYLNNELQTYKGMDKIVLGCTHYVFVREGIEKATGAKTCDCYDKIIEEVESLSAKAGRGRLRFMFTGPRKDEEYNEILSKI